MNDDFENLQKLIALKRFEQPPEGFVEDFMREFHARQREAANKKTSLELFWEKVGGFLDSLSGPAWGGVGATAALVVASLIGMSKPDQGSLPSSKGYKAIDYRLAPGEEGFKATPFIFGEEVPPGPEDEKKKQEQEAKMAVESAASATAR